jgi:hypothetical protein
VCTCTLPSLRMAYCSFVHLPSPGGGGSAHMSAAKCETGWGEGLSSRTVSQLRDHPTPPLRVDPPPPGEGKSRARSQLKHTSAFSRRNPPEFCNSHLALFRGRRECRAPGAPAAARVVVVNTRVSHHGHTGNARHSPRNGFNSLLRALPGDRALLSPSSAKLLPPT